MKQRVLSGGLLALALVLSVLLAPAAPQAQASAARGIKISTLAGSTMFSTSFWSYDVNASGAGVAAWVDSDSGHRKMRVARRSANGGWSRPQTLSAAFSWKGVRNYAGTNSVDIDDRGRATVVWTQSKGRSVLVKAVTSKGKRGWSKPQTLSAKGDRAGFPRVSVSSTGYAVVQWAGNFDLSVENFTTMASYRAPGGRWEAAQRLDTDPAYPMDARASAPAIDDRGIATVAMDQFGAGRIQVATRGPSTGWTQTTLASGSLDQPAVATTRDGRRVALWRDASSVFVRRGTPDGAWGAPEMVAAGSLPVPNNATAVGIAETGRVAVYAQQVDTRAETVMPFLVIQDAPGAPWIRENVSAPLATYAWSLFLPQLEVGPAGDVTLSWEQQVNAKKWPLAMVRRRSAAGVWGPTHRLPGKASNPMIGTDAQGRTSLVFGGGDRRSCCISVRTAKVSN